MEPEYDGVTSIPLGPAPCSPCGCQLSSACGMCALRSRCSAVAALRHRPQRIGTIEALEGSSRSDQRLPDDAPRQPQSRPTGPAHTLACRAPGDLGFPERPPLCDLRAPRLGLVLPGQILTGRRPDDG